MIEFILDVVRFIIYTWGIYEVGCLTSMFWLASRGENQQSRFALSTLIFSASVLFMVVTLLLMNILGSVFPQFSLVIRNAIVFPVLAIAISAKLLKRKYTQ